MSNTQKIHHLMSIDYLSSPELRLVTLVRLVRSRSTPRSVTLSSSFRSRTPPSQSLPPITRALISTRIAVNFCHRSAHNYSSDFPCHRTTTRALRSTSEMGRFQGDSVAELIYRAFTRKNSVYVSVIMIGAVIGEKMVADFIDGCWHSSNQGKFYEDIPNLGTLAEGDE